MSRPSQERVEDGLITWQGAVYELHREIDKLDQEKEILGAQVDSMLFKNKDFAIAQVKAEVRYLDKIKGLEQDLIDARLIAREQEDGHITANLRNVHLEEKIRDLDFRLDAYQIAESLAVARIQELTREIRGCNGELGCAAYKLIRPGETF